MSKLQPLPGYILIEPIKEDSKSTGGVYLPDSAKDKPMKGKVVAVGDYRETFFNDGKELRISWDNFVEKGQIVIYKKWVNQEVKHEGKEYLLVKFDELLAVIE